MYVLLFTQILNNMFQDPHWVPETQGRTKPYIYIIIIFLYIHICDKM